MHMFSLLRRLKDTNINVYSANPGGFNTEMANTDNIEVPATRRLMSFMKAVGMNMLTVCISRDLYTITPW